MTKIAEGMARVETGFCINFVAVLTSIMTQCIHVEKQNMTATFALKIEIEMLNNDSPNSLILMCCYFSSLECSYKNTLI